MNHERDRVAEEILPLGGEATFKVAKDPSRPFVVRAGDVYAPGDRYRIFLPPARRHRRSGACQ